MDFELETRNCFNHDCTNTFRVSKNHGQKFCCDICQANCQNNFKDGKAYYRVGPEGMDDNEKLKDPDGMIKMDEC